PSTQAARSLSNRLDVEASLKDSTKVPVTVVRLHSGAVSTLPTTVIGVSNILTPWFIALTDADQVGRDRHRPDLWTARVVVDGAPIARRDRVPSQAWRQQAWRRTSSAGSSCAASSTSAP